MASSPGTEAAASAAVLDLEILRAQMVNALSQAVQFLMQANEGLHAHVVLGRVADMHVGFQLRTNQTEPRLYTFVLRNPDGSEANLSRIGPDGNLLDLDAVDRAFMQAIGASLGGTVAMAYEHMFPGLVRPTHAGTSTVQ